MFCKSTTTDIASCVSYLLLSKVCSSIYFIIFFSFLSSAPGKGHNSRIVVVYGSGDSVDAQVVSWWQHKEYMRSESQYSIDTVMTEVSIIHNWYININK